MEKNTGKLTLPNEKDFERAELLLYILAQMTQNERPKQSPKISKTPFGPLVLFDNPDNGYKIVFNRVLHGGTIFTNTARVILNGKKLPPLKGNEIERNHYLQIVRDMKDVGLLNVIGKVATLNMSFLASAAKAILQDSNEYPYQTAEQDRMLMHRFEKMRRREQRTEKANAQQAEKVRSIIAKYTGH